MAMKRLLVGLTSLGAAILLCGCPIYSDSGAESVAVTCQGALQDCPTNECTDSCIPWQCTWVGDCPSGYACQQSACVPLGSDCTTTGCADGYICKLSNGTPSCVVRPASGWEGDSSASSVPSDAGSSTDVSRIVVKADASVVPDAAALETSADSTYSPDSAPIDATSDVVRTADVSADGELESGLGEAGGDGALEASDGGVAEAATDADSGATIDCNADSECAALSGRCVNGTCVPTSSLCSDGTQCNVPGFRCVDGVCEPPCSGSSPVGCPVGYACDTELGACSFNADPCTGSGPSTCPAGSVCVEERCVSPCVASEAGPACALADHVCVNGGCIPDEGARFACKNDGQSALLANACTTGSVCLHHDCYVQCEATAEGGGSCANPSWVCKEVTVAAGTYAVCAPSDGLGSECDVASMIGCPAGHLCVDGICK